MICCLEFIFLNIPGSVNFISKPYSAICFAFHAVSSPDINGRFVYRKMFLFNYLLVCSRQFQGGNVCYLYLQILKKIFKDLFYIQISCCHFLICNVLTFINMFQFNKDRTLSLVW